MSRTYQDDAGVWWHEFSESRRTRCALLECAGCGQQFPSWRAAKFCSRLCAGTKPWPRFTPEQESEVLALYQSGASALACAKQFGANEGTILSLIKRAGIPAHPKGGPARAYTDAEIAAAIKQYQAGDSLKAIGFALGTNEWTASRLLREQGINTSVKRRKVERYFRKDGYVDVWIPADDLMAPMRDGRGMVREHRLALARKIGRPLELHETVHHINGDRADNRPENLQPRNGRHGKGVVMQCLDCGSHNVGRVEITTAADATGFP